MSKAGSVTFTSGWDTEVLGDPLGSQIFGDALVSQVLEGEALGDASHSHKDFAMERALAPSPSVDLRDKGLQQCHVICGIVCDKYLPALKNWRVGIGVLMLQSCVAQVFRYDMRKAAAPGELYC